MKIELLEEPLIEFANDFLCDDPKKGIITTGFYSISNNTHRSEIHYSVIGTKKQIGIYNDFVDKLSNPIESNSIFKIKNQNLNINSDNGEIEFEEFTEDENEFKSIEVINKKLNPDFPGFNEESCFKCKFLNNPDNDFVIKTNDIANIIESDDTKSEKLFKIVDIFKSAYLGLAEKVFSIFIQQDLILHNSHFQNLDSLKKEIKSDHSKRAKNIPCLALEYSSQRIWHLSKIRWFALILP